MSPNRYGSQNHKPGSANRRINVWYGALILILMVCLTRLFYLQIVRQDHYKQAALSDQLHQYTIAAERGIVYAHQGGSVVPLVLNQELYTLYADPTFIKQPNQTASKVAAIMQADSEQYAALMKTKNTRYVVLAKRVSPDQQSQIEALKLPGIGTQAQDYRVYPQGSLASNLLGFVNDNGQGNYGLEQYFNDQLSGTPGKLKAITDANGVPLAASRDNVQVDPINGENITLTVNLAMQQQLETILKAGLDNVHSSSGGALIMDPNTGNILAMADYPTYDPSKFYDVKDLSTFTNPLVDAPLEVGSVMKSLTIAAGLNENVITPTTTYADSGTVSVDGSTIKDVLTPPANPSIQDVLTLSLNTGAVHVLSLLGGGQLNVQARTTWHTYMTEHFQLGKPTGIEQPDEASGSIPDPINGYTLNLQYANTAFGQGMTATILQMASAFSSVINGGKYYKPHLVDSMTSDGGKISVTNPKLVKSNVVSSKVSDEVVSLLANDFQTNHAFYQSNVHDGFVIGGKTGTAQIALPGGGYDPSHFNGDFIGFVGGDKPQYVVAVLVNKPDIPSYDTAGAKAAAPIFGKISDMLINGGNVTPISQ